MFSQIQKVMLYQKTVLKACYKDFLHTTYKYNSESDTYGMKILFITYSFKVKKVFKELNKPNMTKNI